MVGRLWRTIRRLGPGCDAFPTGILGRERVRREGTGRDGLGKGRQVVWWKVSGLGRRGIQH